jgi:osmoprotectant transport system permease protein
VAEGRPVTPLIAAVFDDFGNAIDFLLHERESVSGETRIGGGEIIDLTLNHLALSGAAVAIATIISVPIGLYLGHHAKGEFAAINISNVGRAVPTLVLLGFFIAYLGFGFTSLMISLAVLAIPPILTNTYVGTRQVDRDSVDAARGMGMTAAQIMRRVELPLAIAIIFAGIRISAVNVVATATIAPLGSVESLGTPIISANVYGADGRLGAAIAVTVLTLAVAGALTVLQRALTPRGLKFQGQSSEGGRSRPLIRRAQATS